MLYHSPPEQEERSYGEFFEVNKSNNPFYLFRKGLDSPNTPVWYDKDMLEGRCRKCGTHLLGWALLNPRNQSCPKCGRALEIMENGKKVSEGYSPFTAKEYKLDLPASPTEIQEQEKPGSQSENIKDP